MPGRGEKPLIIITLSLFSLDWLPVGNSFPCTVKGAVRGSGGKRTFLFHVSLVVCILRPASLLLWSDIR